MSEKQDHEYSMARSELATIMSAAKRLRSKMKGEGEIKAWVQSKITKAADYISKVHHYLEEYLGEDEAMMAESAEGKIEKASHEIEIDVKISKEDMERLRDGEAIELKDKTGNNTFTVRVSA